MPGQPNIPGNWVFDVAAEPVEIGGTDPAIIVNSGAGNLQFRSTITNSNGTVSDAGLSGMINGQAGEIAYFATQLDAAAPTTVALTPTAFNMTAPHPQQVLSAAFNTNGGAGNLDVGTWLVTVLVHFPGTAFAPTAAAFTQVLIQVI